MGNTKSSHGKNQQQQQQPQHQQSPLAIIAVAKQLAIEKFQILELRNTLAAFADRNGHVEKLVFREALKRAKITHPQQIEILELLFTMWDQAGEEKIPYKPFSIGISPLACANSDTISTIRFALQMIDDNGNGCIIPEELQDVLRSKAKTFISIFCCASEKKYKFSTFPTTFLQNSSFLTKFPISDFFSCSLFSFI